MPEKPARDEAPLVQAPPRREHAGLEDVGAEPSAAEQAVDNEREALESGEESPA